MTIDLIVGTRPNIVKLGPVWQELERRGAKCRVVHTGQHSEAAMSADLFRDLGLRGPSIRLNANAGPRLAQEIRLRYGGLIDAGHRPGGVVVFGDVTSTLACAEAAHSRKIPLAHVEAGLRSFDENMPEEHNRIATDAIADVLFVSEPSGVNNLQAEGIPAERIHHVGNVMIDTLMAKLAEARALPGQEGRYAYATLHRPANVDDPERLRAFVDVFVEVSQTIPIVMSVHPRTRQRLEISGLQKVLDGADKITCLPPRGYLASVRLMDGAKLVITDSGGMQEETTWLGVPCLTLRTTTERPITLAMGTNRLLPQAPRGLVDAIKGALFIRRREPAPEIHLWDGRASERIAEILLSR